MDEQIQVLLSKYIASEASPAERAVVENWIAESPANEAAYIEMYDLWHTALSAADASLVDTNEAYSRLQSMQQDQYSRAPKSKVFRMVALIAASLAAIVMVSIWLFGNAQKEQATATALQEVTVPVNTKKKIVLPDSTLIWLNAETSLKWDNDFNNKNRTVYLEGEAYFEIAPGKKELPFIVKTSQYTIRDIGTSFNVKAHTAASTFETVVIEGIVSVKGNFSKDNSITEVTLLKNDVLKVRNNKVKQVTDTLTVSVKPVVEFSKIKKQEIYTGWKDDMLVFDDEYFTDVVKTLEKKYSVQIEFDAASLAEKRYSGSFNAGTDIVNVLDVIVEVTPGMEYKKTGNRIVIKLK